MFFRFDCLVVLDNTFLTTHLDSERTLKINSKCSNPFVPRLNRHKKSQCYFSGSVITTTTRPVQNSKAVKSPQTLHGGSLQRRCGYSGSPGYRLSVVLIISSDSTHRGRTRKVIPRRCPLIRSPLRELARSTSSEKERDRVTGYSGTR